MKYFQSSPVFKVKLKQDLSKHIKRGNPWIFSDALLKNDLLDGSYVVVQGSRGDEICGHGFFSANVNLSVRLLTQGQEKFTDKEFEQRFYRALSHRRHLFSGENNSFRLLNGEGDELPGIVADYYAGVVVLKLDGSGSENFWKKNAIAELLMTQDLFPVRCVYFKRKNREEVKGEILAGADSNLHDLEFLENNIIFRSNIIDGAKTGFFLDQRDNRNFIRNVSHQKTLLNLFGHTGGFSIYGGLGGATRVTTVDISREAIEGADKNWRLNHLPAENHQGICADAFEFVSHARAKKELWDLVITDPPSFAPNQKSIEAAQNAYMNIFSSSLQLVKPGGGFVASSCSGHIQFELFLEIVQMSLSKGRKKGKVLAVKGQPEDHPYPLALPQMRYLKFIYLQVF